MVWFDVVGCGFGFVWVGFVWGGCCLGGFWVVVVAGFSLGVLLWVGGCLGVGWFGFGLGFWVSWLLVF